MPIQDTSATPHQTPTQTSHAVKKFHRVQRITALLLLACLSSTTLLAVPEAPTTIYNGLGELEEDLSHKIAVTDFRANLISLDAVASFFRMVVGREQAFDRIAISPHTEDGSLTTMQGERVDFCVAAYSDGKPVGGIDFKWTVEDVSRKSPPRALTAGIFQPRRPGTYAVTATSADGQSARVMVDVYFNEGYSVRRLLEKNDADRSSAERQGIAAMRAKGYLTSREISSRRPYNANAERALYETDRQNRALIRSRQAERRLQFPSPFGPSPDATRTSGTALDDPHISGIDRADAEGGSPEMSAPARMPRRSAAARPIDDDGWNGSNWYTADDRVNWTGTPEGAAPDSGVGNGNLELDAPVLSLAGRGLDVSLGLRYNSRLWSKSGTTMSYDSDKGFPAAGWSLGFGKLIYMGGNGGCMFVTPDGTRRSYDGTANIYSNGTYYSNYYTGHTTDGSFIDYTCSYTSSTYGTMLSGTAKLANGTTITFSSPTTVYDQAFPSQITDAQGNYVNITYVNGHGPEIDTVTDTLGRVISFNYDSSNRLISITGPGFGGATRTYARLHYAQITLNYAFASGYATANDHQHAIRAGCHILSRHEHGLLVRGQ